MRIIGFVGDVSFCVLILQLAHFVLNIKTSAEYDAAWYYLSQAYSETDLCWDQKMTDG